MTHAMAEMVTRSVRRPHHRHVTQESVDSFHEPLAPSKAPTPGRLVHPKRTGTRLEEAFTLKQPIHHPCDLYNYMTHPMGVTMAAAPQKEYSEKNGAQF